MLIDTTPECVGSQTVGPYYSIGLDYLVSETAAGPDAPGTHVTVAGTLFDADGTAVPDAVIEVWQPDAQGRFSESVPLPADLGADIVSGFARLSTQREGRFLLHTVKPGALTYPDGRSQAPHLVVLIFLRGILRHLVTRMYFPAEQANASDPVLGLIPESRRATLIATRQEDDPSALHWDIHLQGPDETVFFDC